MYVRRKFFTVRTKDKKLHKATKIVLGVSEHQFMHCHIKSRLKAMSFVNRPLAYSTAMKSQWALSRYKRSYFCIVYPFSQSLYVKYPYDV